MPVEGAWERRQTPLRKLSRRELRFLWSTVAVLLIASVATVAIALGQSSPPVPANCIQVTGGSTMGGANYRVCGADRAAWCREQAAHDSPMALAVQARCRALGLSPRSARP